MRSFSKFSRVYRCLKQNFCEFRNQLRTAVDERVHDAMVSHVVLQLSSSAHGAPGLGSDIPRREHGALENRSGHLGRVIRVSIQV